MSDLNQWFLEHLIEYNIILSSSQIEAFKIYANFLLEKNKQFNLTSHNDLKMVYEKGFLDSLSLIPHLERPNELILDIGTGAGFPGIPLAIVRADIQFHLLESNQKKVLFLEEVKDLLKLDNVWCIRTRAEDYLPQVKYDYVISRAVAKMPLLVEFGYPLVKVGGKIIGYKGKSLDLEMINSSSFLNKYRLDYKWINAKFLDTEHKFAVIKKTSNINLKRRPMAKIKNSPLW